MSVSQLERIIWILLYGTIVIAVLLKKNSITSNIQSNCELKFHEFISKIFFSSFPNEFRNYESFLNVKIFTCLTKNSSYKDSSCHRIFLIIQILHQTSPTSQNQRLVYCCGLKMFWHEAISSKACYVHQAHPLAS